MRLADWGKPVSKTYPAQFGSAAYRGGGLSRALGRFFAPKTRVARPDSFDIRSYGADLLEQARRPEAIENAKRLPAAYTYTRPTKY